MSLSGFPVAGKDNIRLRPSVLEGVYIKYALSRSGFRMIDIQKTLGLSSGIVPLVIYGKRRSPRVEGEIAKILGRASWNDVVREARSETKAFTLNSGNRSPRRTQNSRRSA